MGALAHESDHVVAPGEIIAGKYRIEGTIGAGGMGYVVAATHVQLNQRVAIKFLNAESVDDPDSAPRLLREARAAVALSSEHVARVHDVGTLPSGAPFIVMEYLEGETLASRLGARAPLSVEEVTMIAKQVCAALGEAHRAGIVHRDVKPANIFITRRDGREVVKVLDFGIAKMTDPLASFEENLTSTSQILGTPRYMSPEQLGSTRNVGPPTDVWALGVTLYESLTGKPAFKTGSAFEVGARILSTELPRLSDARTDVPPSLEAIIDRCLKKDPEERFANADDVLTALEGGHIAPLAPLLPKHTQPLLPPTRVAERTSEPRVPAPPAQLSAPATALLPAPMKAPTPPRAVVALIIGIGVAGLAVSGLSVMATRRATRPLEPMSTEPPAPAATSASATVGAATSASAAPEEAVTAVDVPPVQPSAAPTTSPSARRPGPHRRLAGPQPTARATAITRPPDER